MDKSILQEYLNLQFIPLDDDTVLGKLKKASAEIAKKLQKDKSKIIPYTLVALDPQVPNNDTSLAETKEIIIKNWAVFATKASDNLITYFRAVILEALQTIAETPQFAGIIWLTGSNVFPYYNLGRETDLLKEWIESIGRTYEEKAEEQWVSHKELLLDNFKQITINVTLTTSQVSTETITTELKAASNSQNQNGGANPYQSSQGNPWSNFFSIRVGEGLSKEINRALTSQETNLKKGLEGYSTQFNEYFVGLGEYFKNISKQMILRTQSLQRRSQLLWIKEALFSVGQKKSYRDISKYNLPFVLAKDMQSLITPIYPTSVDFFIKEILRSVLDNADEKLSLSILLASDNLQCVQNILGNQNIDEFSRKSLTNYIQRLALNQTNIAQLENETGIKPESQISLTDFTVYLLHDLQSIKLATLK
jgi:hypothetical protein